MTLEQTVAAVMRRCRNAFEYDRFEGTITVSGGAVTPAPDCEWIWLEGSLAHDGLYHVCAGIDDSTEQFEGTMWRLAPPRDFIELCGRVADYSERVNQQTPISETFGGYSRTMATGSKGTAVQTWQEAFTSDLAGYEKHPMKRGVFW